MKRREFLISSSIALIGSNLHSYTPTVNDQDLGKIVKNPDGSFHAVVLRTGQYMTGNKQYTVMPRHLETCILNSDAKLFKNNLVRKINGTFRISAAIHDYNYLAICFSLTRNGELLFSENWLNSTFLIPEFKEDFTEILSLSTSNKRNFGYLGVNNDYKNYIG